MTILVALAIVLLGLADIALTREVLRRGGVEVNPIMRWLMEYSPLDWTIVKFLVHAGVASVVMFVQEPAVFWGGVAFAVIYAGIVAWNVHVLVWIRG